MILQVMVGMAGMVDDTIDGFSTSRVSVQEDHLQAHFFFFFPPRLRKLQHKKNVAWHVSSLRDNFKTTTPSISLKGGSSRNVAARLRETSQLLADDLTIIW